MVDQSTITPRGKLCSLKSTLSTSQLWAEQHRRIERVRYLKSMGWNAGEIKVACSAEFGINRRSIEQYIAVAAKRQREASDISPEDRLANALVYWRNQLWASHQQLERIAAQLAEKSVLLKQTVGPDRVKIESALLALEEAWADAMDGACKIRDRMDRLNGLVHSGGSASVIVNQQFINGGLLTEVQRAEQLESMGFEVAPALPVAPASTKSLP